MNHESHDVSLILNLQISFAGLYKFFVESIL